MKKFLAYVSVLIIVLSLTACTSSKLADTFTEDTVISRAKKTVEVINTLDYDAMVSEMREDL